MAAGLQNREWLVMSLADLMHFEYVFNIIAIVCLHGVSPGKIHTPVKSIVSTIPFYRHTGTYELRACIITILNITVMKKYYMQTEGSI